MLAIAFIALGRRTTSIMFGGLRTTDMVGRLPVACDLAEPVGFELRISIRAAGGHLAAGSGTI